MCGEGRPAMDAPPILARSSQFCRRQFRLKSGKSTKSEGSPVSLPYAADGYVPCFIGIEQCITERGRHDDREGI